MEGAKVYFLEDGNVEWRKATVLSALGGGKYNVKPELWECEEPGSASLGSREVDASKMEGGSLPFQNANMPENGFPDMTTLDHLHEAALLHNLRVRFFAGGNPYTYTADIVIAVNPYAWFPQLYTDEMRKEYLVFDRSRLAPHVYATSSAAYSGLQETKQDQAILVSGESGAGKTETVKILMGHLALIASSDDSSHIKRIVESNPLLESFGNAQTVRNDNSSRFGKFIELELNDHCRLVGSKCRTYLLEKSRVVGQDTGERNYHIFYQMLAADPAVRASFGLGNMAYTRDTLRYTKLGASKTDTIEGKPDAERFALTVSALGLVAVDGDVLQRMLRALAGVLLIGQYTFTGTEEEACLTPETKEDAAGAAEALGVQAKDLEHALTKRTIRTRNEEFVKPLRPADAEATRDALAKELYSRVFDWLVCKICLATAAPPKDAERFVGLLDIFGFESFAINRFEQFCINYANEKLQQKFTHDVFKAVQQEYAEEGIPWDKIEFKDNAPVLALVESKLGIVAMLNEECVRPKGSDENFVSKLVSVHKADPAFSTPKLGKLREVQFSIAHYAGSVTYTTTGWLERNKDSISNDVVELMRKASNELIASIFSEEADGAGGGDAPAGGGKAPNTVATKFRNSLKDLMDTIGKTTTQYVRCIKPNKNKSAREVDGPMVLEQLRCAGVVEAIRISRAGFPARMPLKDFVQRFSLLVRAIAGARFGCAESPAVQAKAKSALPALVSGADPRAASRAVLSAAGPEDQQQYEVGRTRVYFKVGVLELLEERRSMLLQAAASEISRRVRGRQAWRKFREVRAITLKAQAMTRMLKHRKKFQRIRQATITCQSYRRGVLANREVMARRRAKCAVTIQAFVRGRGLRRAFVARRRAAAKIQALARMRACRKQYLLDLKDFKESAKLENQVKALQAKLAAQERALKEQKAAALEGIDATSPTSASGMGGERPSSVSGGSVAGGGEPSQEILEALQALATENAKLRMELEEVKQQNLELRRENKELKGQSARSDWISSMLRTSRSSKDDHHHSRDHKERKHNAGAGGSSSSATPKRAAAAAAGNAAAAGGSAAGAAGDEKKPKDAAKAAAAAAAGAGDGTEAGDLDGPPNGLCLHLPLSSFWEDVPCSGLPILKSGSEVHLKLGPNVLMVDDHGKHLIWRKWMNVEAGYTRAQMFYIERRAALRSGGRGRANTAGGPGAAIEDGAPEDGCLGLAFALRSARTSRYVVAGGMFDRYKILVSAERPEDAMVFTFVPLAESAGTAAVFGAEGDSKDAVPASEYTFALRMLNENKMLKLRKDGYCTMTSVSDSDADIHYDTMAAALEYLRPCSSYEIVVHDKLVGLAVSKDLPLRVVGFNSMSMTGDHVPGPAELTGRVKINDVIATVNGQDIDGIPRVDALRMIACKRPVTLGFRVAGEFIRRAHSPPAAAAATPATGG